MNDLARRSAALASPKRLLVLHWLKNPTAYFPPQVHGDIERDGVCGVFIADKLAVSRATTSMHLKQLVDAGFVRACRIGKYTYFKLIEAEIAQFGRDLVDL